MLPLPPHKHHCARVVSAPLCVTPSLLPNDLSTAHLPHWFARYSPATLCRFDRNVLSLPLVMSRGGLKADNMTTRCYRSLMINMLLNSPVISLPPSSSLSCFCLPCPSLLSLPLPLFLAFASPALLPLPFAPVLPLSLSLSFPSLSLALFSRYIPRSLALICAYHCLNLLTHVCLAPYSRLPIRPQSPPHTFQK